MQDISERDAVVSAANVLMVALLKMNRVIIPVFLKWRRACRLRKIQRADRDLRRHERRSSMGRFPRAKSHYEPGDDKQKTAGTSAAAWASSEIIRISPRVTRSTTEEEVTKSAALDENLAPELGADEGTPIDTNEPQQEMNNNTTAKPDEHLRNVQLLQLARAEQVHLFVYTSFVTVIITIVSIIVYGGGIIALVLSLFPFGTAQSIIFSFSLIATALISESEVLLQRKKQSGGKDKTDLTKYRYKTNAAKNTASRMKQGTGDVEVGSDDLDHFSDLDV